MSKDYSSKLLEITLADGVIRKTLAIGNQSISFGTDVENTISLANPSLPKSILLFEKVDNCYYLLLTDTVGSVSVTIKGITFSTDDLIVHGLLTKRSKNSYLYKIRPDCTGKITINNVFLEFSLINAPPPPLKPVIPREFRKKVIAREDLGFLSVLIITLALHVVLAIRIESYKLPVQDMMNIKKVPKRFAKLILGVTPKQLKEITQPKAEAKKKKKEEALKEEQVEEPKQEKEKPKETEKKEEKPKEVEVAEKKEAAQVKKPVPEVDERTKRRNRLKTRGVLAILAGKKVGSTGKKTVSHFIQNKALSQSLDKVLTKLGGLQNIKPSEQKAKGIENDTAVTIDTMIAKLSEEQKANVKEVTLKEKKRANVKKLFDMEGSGAGNPKRSKQVISNIVQTYLTGLKYLYNRELRKDPTLEGKVIIQFTILASGKVANCMVKSSTMNNKRFEKSILKRLRRWQFEPIEEGEVVITYPFVFFPLITG